MLLHVSDAFRIHVLGTNPSYITLSDNQACPKDMTINFSSNALFFFHDSYIGLIDLHYIKKKK
jgi:hypothetical protein